MISTVGSVGIQPQLILTIPGSRTDVTKKLIDQYLKISTMCEQFDILTHFSVNVRTFVITTWPPNAMHLETDNLDQILLRIIHKRCKCQRQHLSFMLSLGSSLLKTGINDRERSSVQGPLYCMPHSAY